MNLIDSIIPFTVTLFVIAVSVVLLYQNFQKNLIALELEKAAIEANQRDELLRNSIRVQEEERKRIAQDLHDDLGAVISIIKMNLILFGKAYSTAENESRLAGSVTNLVELSDKAITSVRMISHQLMPPHLEHFGLVKTLESYIEHLNRLGELEAVFRLRCMWPQLKWETSLGIYRIIMEMINNTIKHAQAKHLLLEFDCAKGSLVINFEDDGRGFPEESKTDIGLGLISMQARARALKGEFNCANRELNGIKATIRIPVDQLQQ